MRTLLSTLCFVIVTLLAFSTLAADKVVVIPLSKSNYDDLYYSKDYVDALEERISALESKLIHFSRSENEVTISGANLNIISGSGSTAGAINGLGNLIIGYNELRGAGDDRTGSHNLVIGRYHNYSSYGGLVAGYYNTISNTYATVTAGRYNQATGTYSSVSGGVSNTASGDGSSVSGGENNTAGGGSYNSVNGGRRNIACGGYSSILGGSSGYTGDVIWEMGVVVGCDGNSTTGGYSTVSGGLRNGTTGDYSAISGGASLYEADDRSLANPYHP
jgi:hypothetical protein